MGLFFEANEGTGRSKTPTIPIHTARQLGCKVCPLAKVGNFTPDMPASGSKKPLIYILGEAPGETEDKRGVQFVGKSGQLLRSHFPKDWEDAIRFNNVVRSRPPGNRDPDPIEIECCRISIEDDIAEAKPEVIMGVGRVPLTWAIGKPDIAKWRARLIPIKVKDHVCWFYPIYHPAYILRQQRKSKKTGQVIKTQWDHMFKRDIDRVLDLLEDEKLPTPTYIEKGHLDNIKWTEGLKSDRELEKVFGWLDKLLEEPYIGFDYETTHLRPYYENARILTVAVGTHDRSYAFPIRYPNAWSPKQLEQLEAKFKDFLLRSGKKICHNLKFEQEWTAWFFGNECLRKTKWEDTMAQAYAIDERRGMLDLDTLIRVNFGFWLKSLSNLDRSRMIDYPLSKILPYNGLDAKWTFNLFHKQQEILDQDERIELVHKNLIRTSPTLTLAQKTGLVANESARNKFDTTFSKQLADIEGNIRTLPEVKEYEERFHKRFRPSAPEQLLDLLRDVLGLEDEIKDKNNKYTTAEPVLKGLSKSIDVAKMILEWRAIAKKKSTYIDPLPNLVFPTTGRLHTNYNPYVTTTGRLCVAKGTKIEVVRDLSQHPEGINVEDVKVGDLVYTYDDNLNLTLRKVYWAGKTGTKRVVRVHWRSNKGRKGYLDVTGNHPIRLINGEYVRADKLKAGNRVLSLSRSTNDITFIHWTNQVEPIKDSRFIYGTVRGDFDSTNHIHHKDHNHFNNVLNNLQCLTPSAHSQLHHAGEGNGRFIKLARIQCLQLLARAKGCPTKVGYDFQTFINKLEGYEINWLDVKRRYGRNGVYLSRGLILQTLAKNGFNRTKTQKELGTNFYNLTRLTEYYGIQGLKKINGHSLTKFGALKALAKVRGQISKVPYDYGFFNKKLKVWDIDWQEVKNRYTRDGKYVASTTPNNHKIIKVEWLDEFVDVYDMGVEDTHNFIAGELCISNSSDDPNMQNWPNRKGKEIREIIAAPEGHWMVGADYGQIEARIIGIVSQDQAFCEALWNNYDIHKYWAERIAEAYPNVIGGKNYLGNQDKLNRFRKDVKNQWTFPAFYGSSPYSIAASIGVPTEIVLELFDEFWDMFRGVKKWQKWVLNRYERLGYVETLTGRRRHAPLSMNEIINSGIQGTASDICVDAMNRLSEAGIQVVMNVHDEIDSYVPDDKLEDQTEQIAEVMCSVPFKWVNIPIAVEVSVGPDWYNMEEIGTFYSTDYMKVDRKMYQIGHYLKM